MYKKSNPSAFCVVFKTIVNDDLLEWSLNQMVGKSYFSLKVGESYSFSEPELKKNQFLLVKSVPLNKVKSLQVISKRCTEYNLLKEKDGLHLEIVIEGFRVA